MGRLARISLVGAQPEDELPPMVVDLMLSQDRIVTKGIITAGWDGNVNSGELYPFLINAGKFDYGCGFEDEDRFAQTNLCEKAVVVGEYFTFSFRDEDCCYRVRQVTWLDEV